MTAIDRTAYPRLGARLTRDELAVRYDLTETDCAFIDASARGDTGRLMLATLLKTHSTWTTCQASSIHSRSPSSKPCDHFLHIS